MPKQFEYIVNIELNTDGRSQLFNFEGQHFECDELEVIQPEGKPVNVGIQYGNQAVAINLPSAYPIKFATGGSTEDFSFRFVNEEDAGPIQVILRSESKIDR